MHVEAPGRFSIPARCRIGPDEDFLKKYQKENNKNFLIEIDGGINQTNYNLCKKVGCDIVVIGTYFFKDDNYEKTIKELEQYENNNCC